MKRKLIMFIPYGFYVMYERESTIINDAETRSAINAGLIARSDRDFSMSYKITYQHQFVAKPRF